MGFCNSGQSQSTTQGWQDPLGPVAMGAGGRPAFAPTGGPQMRDQIFGYLGSFMPQMLNASGNYAQQLQSAAANPAWNSVVGNASQTAAGNYLNGSPALDRAMAWNRAVTLGNAADENARIKSNYSKNGMGWSTGNEQAQESNMAKANADAANTNAQAYLQNYMAERQNQNAAGQMLSQGLGTPLSYLQGVTGAYTQPLSDAGNILSALSSGGQVYNTGSSGNYSPSTGSDILNGIGSL